MIGLWVFREKLKGFYARFDVFINPLIRFVFGLVVFHMLNGNLGAMARLNNGLVEVMMALVCSVLPYGVMVFLAGILLLAHVSSISLEMAIILLVLLLFILILYFGLQPRDSYLLLLTPIFFHLKIPYAIPILVGLSCGLSSAVTVCCGVMLFYVMQYIKPHSALQPSDGSDDGHLRGRDPGRLSDPQTSGKFLLGDRHCGRCADPDRGDLYRGFPV